MPRLLPETWVGWLILILVVWFAIDNPVVAGGDVRHLGHWMTYAFTQLSTFVRSI